MTFYRLNNEVFHRWKLLPILRSQLIKTNCTAICTHLRSFKPRQMRRRARRTQRQSAILRAWSSSIFFNFLPFGLAICNLKIIFRHSAARLRNFHLYLRVYGGERSAEKCPRRQFWLMAPVNRNARLCAPAISQERRDGCKLIMSTRMCTESEERNCQRDKRTAISPANF